MVYWVSNRSMPHFIWESKWRIARAIQAMCRNANSQTPLVCAGIAVAAVTEGMTL